MSETKEPWEFEQIERKNTTKMNEVENTPLERWNKEEQIRNKAKRTWAKAQHSG